MPIRITGMNSGLDTESIVQAMVMSYTKKKEKVEKSQQKLEWSQEIWKNTNSKVYSLYTGLDKVRFSSGWKSKKTSLSDSSKASVSAGAGAVNGTQTLRITQLAKAGYLTGAKLKNDSNEAPSADTKLSELGVQEGSTVNLKVGDTTHAIEIEKDMTMKDFAGKLSEAGVNASYDAANGRFFIGAKEAGKDNDFTLSGKDAGGTAALQKLGLMAKSSEDIDALKEIKSLGTYKTNGALDERATSKAIKAQFSEIQNSYYDALNAQLALNDQKSELAASRETDAEKLQTRKEIGDYLSAKKNKLDGTATEEELQLVNDLEEQLENDPASMDKDLKYYVQNAKDGTSSSVGGLLTYNNTLVNRYQASVDEWDSQIAELDSQIADYQADMDEAIADLKDNPLLAGYADSITSVDADTVASEAVSKIKSAISELESDDSEGATRVNGQDAEIYLNGAKFTSNSNTFEINGLTINATGVTGDDEITISTSTDTDAVYDKLKDFMDQYNSIINELQGMYNADSAKDFEPLTEDEKAEMSDTEIEKWETKIKDSLLRRDSILRGVISSMTTAMAQSYEVTLKDGSKQKMGLASVGVHTLGFLNAKTNEQYAYHIDGDEDDSNTSAKEDKLRAFIESDPDAAADLFSQVAQGLYKALDTKIGMTTTENSSAFTLYNDKQMTRDLDTYKKQVKEWTTKIEDQEDFYYKKFTAMEKAIANLNSSQSALSGMLG